jgi:hypothetical protein
MATVSLWQVHAARAIVTRLRRALVNVNLTATPRETGRAETLDTVTCNSVITDYHDERDVFITSDHNAGTPFDITKIMSLLTQSTSCRMRQHSAPRCSKYSHTVPMN